MNMKIKLAVATVLFSAVAFPAFADDHDQATLLAGSGRIIEQAAVPANAYASAATWSAHHRAPMHWSAAVDFQAQGSR